MFQYEYEKRPASANSCDSRATMASDWARSYASARDGPTVDRGPRRPLPPRPIVCETKPTKTTVPLKVWVVASASCFAVCAVLVLATIVITKWSEEDQYTLKDLYINPPESIYSDIYAPTRQKDNEKSTDHLPIIDDIGNDIPVLEKLPIFKNIIANRDKIKPDLTLKHQMHPIHDPVHHIERKIEKKDKAKLPESLKDQEFNKIIHERNLNFRKISNDHKDIQDNVLNTESDGEIINENNDKVGDDDKVVESTALPEFKPIKSDVSVDKHVEIKLPESYLHGLKTEVDYEEYYNDENLYDDYMQSNTMVNYLIEKIQELHDWIVKDPDFELVKNSTRRDTKNDFTRILKSLNDSLIEGNVSIVLNTLKDLYFGDNHTTVNNRTSILSNGTDLVSFGILTLDVMLLHNIQAMAWESQETARLKMMRDPDVFAFNALFMEPSKVETKINEVLHQAKDNQVHVPKHRQEIADDFDFGRNFLENILDIGMSTARAAIHLGRAYKNTKTILNQLSNKETATDQLARSVEGGAHALNRLQMSFKKDGVANTTKPFYTELDCVWLLYCRNLIASSRLNAPYGTMARINGVALRILTGELSADKALDTIVYEALTGWSELKCNNMFPRCSKVNPAAVVMESILGPGKRPQPKNKD